MTREEAKNYFKQYGGFHFHMGREEPLRYREYCRLNITPEQEDLWRENLVEAAFDLLEGAEEPLRWYFALCEQVRASVRRKNEFSHRLYQETEKLVEGPAILRAGVLQYMAGSAHDNRNGAICVMHSGGISKNELTDLTERMADFKPEEGDAFTGQERERHLEACRRALRRLSD